MTAMPVILLGGGGHAAAVAAALKAMGRPVAGYIAPDLPSRLNGVAYLGPDEALGSINPGEAEIAVAIGSVKATRVRQRLFEAASKQGFRFATIVHPRAIVDPSARLGQGTQVMAGAIIQAASDIGDSAIINSGAIIEHGCSIGAHVHVSSGAVISGEVRVGACSHIGAGAVILQGCAIGESVTVGAAACVTKNINDGLTVTGIPAREHGDRERQQ